jgi:hypothetical protein
MLVDALSVRWDWETALDGGKVVRVLVAGEHRA